MNGIPLRGQQPDTPIPPGYAKVGSACGPADIQRVARLQSTISSPHPQSFIPSSRSAPYRPTMPRSYSDFGSAYGKPDIRPVTGDRSTISHLQVQTSRSRYEQDLSLDRLSESFQAQSQHAGLYEQQTPINGEDPAPSDGQTPESSSGHSASPTRAETKRQERDEKARRSTAKGDSKKKADEGAKNKSEDSRQKEADRAQDKARKGCQNCP